MRTVIAKIVFRIGGKLTLIRYAQPVYKALTFEEEEGGRRRRVPAGKQKLAHPWAYKLLLLSERIDPEHWEHWAFEHGNIPGKRCTHCKGWIPAEPGW